MKSSALDRAMAGRYFCSVSINTYVKRKMPNARYMVCMVIPPFLPLRAAALAAAAYSIARAMLKKL